MTEAQEQDDLTIPDTDRLFRRVGNAIPHQLVYENGVWRPSSAMFKTERLSVNIESLMTAQGRSPEDSLKDHPDENLVALQVAAVREFKHPIVKQTEAPHDPAHGLVLGKKTSAFANAMVRIHEWIVTPRIATPTE